MDGSPWKNDKDDKYYKKLKNNNTDNPDLYN